MQTWARYAEEGRRALLARDYDSLDRLLDANFDLRARIYRIDEGNFEMIRAARSAGASANFAGSGGAIVGAYKDPGMYQRIVEAMKPLGVAVIRPDITGAGGREHTAIASRPQ
jgi:glucuronokinase